jgi:hypothetical protein
LQSRDCVVDRAPSTTEFFVASSSIPVWLIPVFVRLARSKVLLTFFVVQGNVAICLGFEKAEFPSISHFDRVLARTVLVTGGRLLSLRNLLVIDDIGC